MENIIIIIELVVVILIGIRSCIKHFKGEGGCCGGSSTPVKKKQAIVSLEKDVSDEQIRAVIEKAGYEDVEIR